MTAKRGAERSERTFEVPVFYLYRGRCTTPATMDASIKFLEDQCRKINQAASSEEVIRILQEVIDYRPPNRMNSVNLTIKCMAIRAAAIKAAEVFGGSRIYRLADIIMHGGGQLTV